MIACAEAFHELSPLTSAARRAMEQHDIGSLTGFSKMHAHIANDDCGHRVLRFRMTTLRVLRRNTVNVASGDVYRGEAAPHSSAAATDETDPYGATTVVGSS